MKFCFIFVFLLIVGYSQATTLTDCPDGCNQTCPQVASATLGEGLNIDLIDNSKNTLLMKPCVDFNGIPSYVIEIQANRSKVSHGDSFGLGLFISGAGNVNCSKLRVSIPPYIVGNKTVTMIETDYSGNYTIIKGILKPEAKPKKTTIMVHYSISN